MISEEERKTLPYVTFHSESVEDREESAKQGHYVGRSVDRVHIVPRGSRDVVIKEVSDWFENLSQLVMGERMSRDVVAQYKEAYEAWKRGEELPEDGHPIKTWPVLNEAQVKNVLALGVRTVEQLASANEETIGRLGMSGRNWHQLAQKWLKESKDVGQAVLAHDRLEKENERLKEVITTLQADVAKLKAVAPEASAQPTASPFGK